MKKVKLVIFLLPLIFNFLARASEDVPPSIDVEVINFIEKEHEDLKLLKKVLETIKEENNLRLAERKRLKEIYGVSQLPLLSMGVIGLLKGNLKLWIAFSFGELTATTYLYYRLKRLREYEIEGLEVEYEERLESFKEILDSYNIEYNFDNNEDLKLPPTIGGES